MMIDPAFTLAIAMAAGMIAQTVARHLRIPGIVLLLATGILLGPDGAGIVEPISLGAALPVIVGFAVAVVLFEGGMNLRPSRIRREGRVIRQLITLGALVTALGSTLSAKLLLGWGWRPAILFGTLAIVTGPTVITPLLRRLKLRRSVSTVLEAEGVLLDAVGAVIAVVALEVALSPSGATFARGLIYIISRLIVGACLGIAGGFIMTILLRIRNLVPQGLENVFTLSLVFALFQGSNLISAESGIVAVTVAGMVIGNVETVARRELMEFKEQLTVLLIGLLFVLLAAHVRLEEVRALGAGGILVVLTLMFIIRPLNVLVGTWRSDLNRRQKVLLSWIAPRGIVAAAIASLFALELEQHGFDGSQLRALVFLLIAVTVLVTGLTSGWVAGLLGLRRQRDVGWIILSANGVSRALARILIQGGEEVICIDENPKTCRLAEEDGIRVIYGNGLDERILLRAEVDTRLGVIGLSSNEEVNLLFARQAREVGRLGRVLVGLSSADTGITVEMIGNMGGRIFGGRPFDIEQWESWFQRGLVVLQRYTFKGKAEPGLSAPETRGLLLAMVVHRNGQAHPMDNHHRLKSGDEVTVAVNQRREKEAQDWITGRGWVPS